MRANQVSWISQISAVYITFLKKKSLVNLQGQYEYEWTCFRSFKYFCFIDNAVAPLSPWKFFCFFLCGLVAAHILLKAEWKLLLVVSVRNRLGSSFSWTSNLFISTLSPCNCLNEKLVPSFSKVTWLISFLKFFRHITFVRMLSIVAYTL